MTLFTQTELQSMHTMVAITVLKQIQEQGIDGVRVATVAQRMEIAVGTLYSRWGNREFLLEHTWRTCMGSIEWEVNHVLRWVRPRRHCLAELYNGIVRALPPELDAFFELHYSRCRWQRTQQERDGAIIPSLETYAALNVQHGHFREAPPRAIAGVIWWFVLGILKAGGHDQRLTEWCFDALRRGLLTDEHLAADAALEQVCITEAPPATSLPPG